MTLPRAWSLPILGGDWRFSAVTVTGCTVTVERARVALSQMKLTNEHFSDLYARHSEELYRYLRARVGDQQAALDLVGETFAQAVRAKRRFRGQSLEHARAWLYGIARNLAAMHHRRGFAERKAMTRLAFERVTLEHDPQNEWVQTEATRQFVEESLEQLPREHREAVEMRFVGERTYVNISDSLGVSENLVRARVSRGVRRLREIAFDAGEGRE